MVLGDVMAHELGHLMLRSHKQSLDGIMRPGIEKREMAITTFTKSGGAGGRRQHSGTLGL